MAQSKISGIKIKGSNGKYIITLSTKSISRRKRPSLLSLFFLMIWFGIIGYAFYQELFIDPDKTWKDIIGLSGFFLIGISIVFSMLYQFNSITTILLNKDFIYLNRKIPIGLNYNSKRKTKNWNKTVDFIDTMDSSSGKSITGVELTFFEERNLLVGEHLEKVDRSWLINRLNGIKADLLSGSQATVSDKEAIKFDNTSDRIFTIPKRKWNGDLTFFLVGYLLATLLFVLGAIFIIPNDAPNWSKYCSFFFPLVTFFALIRLLYHIALYKVETVLTIGKELIIERSFLGYPRIKQKSITDLKEVTSEIGFFSTSKSRNRKQLVLIFRNSQRIKIGFYLSDQEIEFLSRVIQNQANEMNEKNKG